MWSGVRCGSEGVPVLVHLLSDLAGGLADGVLADGEQGDEHGGRQGEVLVQRGGQDAVSPVSSVLVMPVRVGCDRASRSRRAAGPLEFAGCVGRGCTV